MTRSLRSSRNPCCTSRASASPRSASSERSWNSSNSTAPTPSSIGSSSTSRVKMPSVMISMRVLRETFEPKPHPQADRLADAFAERMRHPLCRRAGGKPARFQNQDTAACGPRLFGKNERHPRGLAGAGRRDQNGGVALAQRFSEFRQRNVDREWRKFHSSFCLSPAHYSSPRKCRMAKLNCFGSCRNAK